MFIKMYVNTDFSAKNNIRTIVVYGINPLQYSWMV